jgi:type VI secretion system FHA domain protein
MTLVVSVEDLETGARSQFAFMRSPVRIGRSELNDLPLPQPFVSTMHAVVQFDDQQVRYADLGSTNGSRVNGTRLDTNAPALIEPGTEVVIGRLRLTFARRSGAAERPAAPAMATMFAMRAADLPAAAPPLPAEPAPPPPPEVADEVLEPILSAASLELDLAYAEYRGTWEHLRSHVERVLGGLDPATRAGAARRLAQKYAAISAEPQFQELAGLAAGAPGAPAPVRAAPPAAGGGDGTLLLKTFAESYLPASAHVGGRREEIEAFLKQVAEALETYCRSFVEMRKGYEEFGREMGVRTVHGDGPVERARDARQLLGYLLDPAHPGRAAELQRAFADLMVHQVALLNGVVEGAKALMRQIGPEAIEAESPGGVWPLKAQALWKAYQARFQEIYDEESAISGALFGAEFARAYSGMVGEKGGEGGDEGPQARPRHRGRQGT